MAIFNITRCPTCGALHTAQRRHKLCNKCRCQKETTVVHVQKDPFNIYIGRFNYQFYHLRLGPRLVSHKSLYNLGASGYFGNPYKVKDLGREEALRKFQEYFYDRLTRNITYLQGVLALKGEVLGCWCKPAACHGDIIADFLNAINDPEDLLEIKRVIERLGGATK